MRWWISGSCRDQVEEKQKEGVARGGICPFKVSFRSAKKRLLVDTAKESLTISDVTAV